MRDCPAGRVPSGCRTCEDCRACPKRDDLTMFEITLKSFSNRFACVNREVFSQVRPTGKAKSLFR
jgi:hypothetical protein